MKVSRHILAEAIAQKTLHMVDPAQLAREIAAYLLAEHRTAELESILRDVMQYRMDHGVMEAEVVTAHKPTAQVMADVEQLISSNYPAAKTIHLSNRQDASVIGGLRVDMANDQLDMTVTNRLSRFKRLTSEGTT